MNVITYYDKELKQKCYMLRGDEQYANTTDTTLSYDPESFDDELLGAYNYEFTVNVLRELDVIGENSFVEIYDDDEIVLTIPWNSNMSNYEFSLNLTYDVEHNIRARFSGNKLSLPSTSNVLQFNVPHPDRFSTTLTFQSLNRSWDRDGVNNIQVKLVNHNNVALANKPVNLYIDDELVSGVGGSVTNSNGIATFQNVSPKDLFTDDENDRTYTVRAEYTGSDEYAQSEVITTISLGYVVRIDEFASSILNSDSLDVKITMFNQYGYSPSAIDHAESGGTITNDGAIISIWAYQNNTWYRIKNNDHGTLSGGKTTISATKNAVANRLVDNELTWKVRATFNGIDYDSEIKKTTVHTPTSLSFETNKPIVGTGQIATLMGGVSGVYGGIKVVITGDVTGILSTRDDGTFRTTYNATGDGIKNVTATVGSLSQSITFEDVIQYWDAVEGSINKSYTILSPYVLELSSGFKLSPRYNSESSTSIIGLGNGSALSNVESWTLSFKVVNSTNHYGLIVGSWKNVGGTQQTETSTISGKSFLQGQTVTVKCENNKLSVYLDDEELRTNINYISGGYPLIGIVDDDTNHYLTINQVKFIKGVQ